MKTVELEALVAAGILIALVLLVKKGAPAAAQAASNVDAAATGAVLSIPGMSVFQDSAGDFDPVQAGYEAGQQTAQWFASLGSVVSNAAGSVGQALTYTPPAADTPGLYPATFGDYVSM